MSRQSMPWSICLVAIAIGMGTQSAANPPVRLGVGHAMAISLKDEYRTQIIPLAAAAGAEYTALYLLRDTVVGTYPGEDGSFMDLDVQAFVNYDANQGYNEVWWVRFADFLVQCNTHDITPIVTLYDFCCSGFGPFDEYNSYDSDDRHYVARVVQYLNNAGVDYIINIGCERGPGPGYPGHESGPSTAFLNDCIAHLMVLGVSLQEQMCLSNELLVDHYDANDITHIPGYVTDHGNYKPGNTSGHGRWTGTAAYTINDEEKMSGGGYPVSCYHGSDGMGSGWGGSGTIEQYLNYLNASHSGIACLNFWHLKPFNNCQDAVGGEDMDLIFAPNQRAAMIEYAGGTEPPEPGDRTALFVGDLASGGTSPRHIADTNMVSRLVSLGFDVTRVAGSASSAADADGKDLVVISESTWSGHVLAKFKDVEVGVLVMEPFIYDDMLMAGNEGFTATRTSLDIVDATHPLAAGLASGTRTVYSSNGYMGKGVPSANATIVARIDSANPVIFAYETGAGMVGMNAPARRTGFFLATESNEFGKLTADGLALFDAAVNWTSHTGTAPVLLAAASVMTHGAAGDFSVDIDLAEPYAIEPRAGVDHRLVFVFDQPIDIGGASVIMSSGAIASLELATTDVVDDTLVATLAEQPDNNACLTIEVIDVTDTTGVCAMAPATLYLAMIQGEVEAGPPVNLTDLSIVRADLYQTVTVDNFMSDVNADGVINLTDLSLVRDNLYQQAACP